MCTRTHRLACYSVTVFIVVVCDSIETLEVAACLKKHGKKSAGDNLYFKALEVLPHNGCLVTRPSLTINK